MMMVSLISGLLNYHLSAVPDKRRRMSVACRSPQATMNAMTREKLCSWGVLAAEAANRRVRKTLRHNGSPLRRHFLPPENSP
jgi:hypothetical protein